MQYHRSLVIVVIAIINTLYSSAQTQTPLPAGEPENSISSPAAGTAPRSVAYAAKTAPVRIPRFESAPAIDGRLDDGVWSKAAIFGDFVQTQPGDNVPPSGPTEVMMGYDGKNLYIAFRIVQSKENVRATVARRDNIFDDDYVGVYLDTFNDQRQAYVIFFNPLGVQADGVFREGKGEDYSVDLVMDSKGTLTPDGFTIEAAIPSNRSGTRAVKVNNGASIFTGASNTTIMSWIPGCPTIAAFPDR